MISTTQRYGPVPVRTTWYAGRPPPAAALGFARWGACLYDGPAPGWVRLRRTTKLIDLTPEPEALLKSLGKSNAYKIRRAEREGAVLVPDLPLDAFLAFYNAHPPAGRPLLRAGLEGYGGALALTGATKDGVLVAAHAHLLDPASGRARFLHSARLSGPGLSTSERNAVGMANRFLHGRDMLLFKARGLTTYDFGGFYPGKDDSKLASIAAFKDSFGGVVAPETHYLSLPYWGLLRGWEAALALRARLAAARRGAPAPAPAAAGADD